MAPPESSRGALERIIEKVPAWVLSLSIFGILSLIVISIYLEKPFTIAGLQFGAIQSDGKKTKSENNIPVGTIVASVLSPKDFLEHYGNNWVVADGSEVGTDTKYYKITGKRKIPDIRGRFLRGMNLNIEIDPQKDREVGDHQNDSTKIPDSLSISEGSHTHTAEIKNERTTKHAHLDGGSAFWTQKPQHTNESKLFDVTIRKSGDHAHTISGGDSETRPKNTSVYFYIRVDDKMNIPVTTNSAQ